MREQSSSQPNTDLVDLLLMIRSVTCPGEKHLSASRPQTRIEAQRGRKLGPAQVMTARAWVLARFRALGDGALAIASWVGDIVQNSLSCFLVLLIGDHRCFFWEVALHVRLQHLIYVGCRTKKR